MVYVDAYHGARSRSYKPLTMFCEGVVGPLVRILAVLAFYEVHLQRTKLVPATCARPPSSILVHLCTSSFLDTSVGW
eukprot:SAG31_NODE_162_length_21892_cov_343.171936_4_plen_77_part_00